MNRIPSSSLDGSVSNKSDRRSPSPPPDPRLDKDGEILKRLRPTDSAPSALSGVLIDRINGSLEVSLHEIIGVDSKDKEKLKKFIQLNGHNLTNLRIPDYPFDDNELEEIFKLCPHLKHLFIQDELIKELPSHPTLEDLDCSSCSELRELPVFPNLRKLECQRCTNLVELPVLPNLEKLRCRYCHNLLKLCNLPKLEELDCARECFSLRELSDLPNLRRLNCFFSPALIRLSNLPKLEELYCDLCANLIELFDLPNVRTLFCQWCPNLFKLADLPKLENLNCQSCHELTRLPVLPELKNLTLSFELNLLLKASNWFKGTTCISDVRYTPK